MFECWQNMQMTDDDDNPTLDTFFCKPVTQKNFKLNTVVKNIVSQNKIDKYVRSQYFM